LLLVAVGLGAAGLGIAAHATSVLSGVELSTVDARFSIRGAERPPAGVVLVGLDSQSLADLNVRPPIPRRLHARLIDQLHRDGARVIAYDFQFTEPTDTVDDNRLIRSVARAGNVVLATTKVRAGGHTDVFGGDAGVRSAHAVVGNTTFPRNVARGGVIRRLPYSDRGLRSFAVVVAGRATGHEANRSHFSGDGAWIDFAGAAGTIPTVSFSRVLAGRIAPERFRGRVVVVGATDPVLQDVHATAAGEGMPGPEVNANAIATILRGFPLGDAPVWLSVLLIVAAGVVVPASALRLVRVRWLPVFPVAVLVYAVGAQLAFDDGAILPVAAPGLALLAGFLGTLAVANWTDLRERRHLHAAFARFVPPEVVDEVVAQAQDELRLVATRREGTVMFCDLRSFTTTAERLPVEGVIEMLNRYLTEMSDAVLDHGGTVVSYMGDGIMAVFGAPLEQVDHADRALAAAREMLGSRLARFNAWAAEAGVGGDMRIGVGICSGPVMSGNVGSSRRLEYAAVGDTTNTAARLQSMTKEVGCPILISDATRALLRAAAPDLREVGELEVRGRSARLTAWTLGD
jgi:adenylate cyclase